MEIFNNLSNKTKIVIFTILFITITGTIVFSYNRFLGLFKNNEGEVTSTTVSMDLSTDIGFLDCVATQHKCIYNELKKNKCESILKDCKDENYCNNINK